jgi:hypothetical protein
MKVHIVQTKVFYVLILIFTVCCQNTFTAAPVCKVEFPTSSDGQHPELQTPGHQGIIRRAEEDFTQIQVSSTCSNIYFSVDGRQPTTEQAAAWSCANVNDEAVTQWYVERFGGDRAGGAATLHMGFESTAGGAAQTPAPIIVLKNSGQNEADDMDMRSVDPNDLTAKSRIDTFWHTFRQIAADPVGRVLLYRILIEIRREKVKGVGEEEIIARVHSEQDIAEKRKNYEIRNNARCLVVSYDQEEGMWNYYRPSSGTDIFSSEISVSFGGLDKKFPMIGKISNVLDTDANFSVIDFQENEFSSDTWKALLFHEMLHWYQDLRDFFRTTKERYCLKTDLSQSPLVNLFYCNIRWGEVTGCPDWLLTWMYPDNFNYSHYIRLDELRVICGSSSEVNGYLEGDDLSDNAFRISCSFPMRFGYFRNFLMDKEWFEKVRNVATICKQKCYTKRLQ